MTVFVGKGHPQPGLEEARRTEKGREREKHAEDGDRPRDMCDHGARLDWYMGHQVSLAGD